MAFSLHHFEDADEAMLAALSFSIRKRYGSNLVKLGLGKIPPLILFTMGRWYWRSRVNQEIPNQDSHSVIEYDAVMKRLGGDQELFKDFVAIFLEDSPPHIENFNNGIVAKDAAQIRNAVHALKGLASNFGAKEFCLTAQTIEASVAIGELELYDQRKRFLALLMQLTDALKDRVAAG